MIPLALQQGLVEPLERLATRLGRRPALPEHLATGLAGERAAFFHLRRRGYTVVARRWSSARVRGDLDLIAWKADVLCFVEVKTRTARDAMPAEMAVDQGKRVQLRRLARAYLKGFDEPGRSAITTRFDVVSVYLLPSGAEFEGIEGAFGWSEPSRNRW